MVEDLHILGKEYREHLSPSMFRVIDERFIRHSRVTDKKQTRLGLGEPSDEQKKNHERKKYRR
jgi:hypothetical protein